MSTSSPISTEIEYPEEDGQPLGETGIHVEAILSLLDLMRNWYEGRADASVLVDMFLYYREGEPKYCVCPDVFLTLGVPDNRLRRTFKVWEEGKAPDLVVEVTSHKTMEHDLDRKYAIYRDDLKVREYFLFDPEDMYLGTPLVGYRLVDGEYVPIEPVDGRLPSEVMGVHFERDEELLRLYDPQTRRHVLSTEDKADAERAIADAERAKVETERAKVETERARADAERAKVETERAKADAERARADRAEVSLREREQELQRLRRELEALRRGSPGAPGAG